MKSLNTLRYAVLSLCCLLFLPVISVQAQEENREQLIAEQTEELVLYLNYLDYGSMISLFDLDQLAEQAGRALFSAERDVQNFKSGFRSNPPDQLIRNIFLMLEEDFCTATYMGMGNWEGEKRPVVRLSCESGALEYLVLEFNHRQRPRIVDMYMGSRGQTLIASVTEVMQMMVSDSDNWVRSLLGRQDIDRDMVEKMQQLVKARAQGDLVGAYELATTFPAGIRYSRSMLLTTSFLASMVSEQAYFGELALLAEHHGDDPSLAFILMDYYYSVGDFQSAIESLDASMCLFGEDAALLSTKSSLYLEAGSLQQAEVLALQAIDREFDYEDGYWSLANVLVLSRDYTRLPGVFSRLEQIFGYEISPDAVLEEPFYADFVASETFRQWQKDWVSPLEWDLAD